MRSTRCRVARPTLGLPFRTFETVATDTPTAAAMSFTVAMGHGPENSGASHTRTEVSCCVIDPGALYSECAHGVAFLPAASVTFYYAETTHRRAIRQ